MTEFVIAGPIPVIAGCDYRSKARPMRKVWNDSFRSMLMLLDGEPVQLEAWSLSLDQLRPSFLRSDQCMP